MSQKRKMEKSQSWANLYAELSQLPSSSLDAKYSVYIIKVLRNFNNLPRIDYYVGSTGKNTAVRFEQHLVRHPYSARIFKSGKYVPKSLKMGWMSGIPKFHDRTIAEVAEGRVAEFLRSLGYVVDCDNNPLSEGLTKSKNSK